MQETRNKRLAVTLVALFCVTLAVYFFGQADGSVDVDKNLFKGFDMKDIDHVMLESKKDTVVLKFNGSRWLVNDRFSADASMIQVLFATLQQAEPKRPVSPSIRDSVSRGLEQDGVKVSLFSSGTKEISFYAGGNARKTQAFFSSDQENRAPYIVTIPGYRVYVSGIFELTENDWKDKLVFGFNWRNFESLEARFPESPEQGFKVSLQENYFGIEGMASVDTAKLNQFLDDVSLLTAVQFVNDPIFDNNSSKPASMVITVRDIAQRAFTLEIYPHAATSETIPGLINGTQWAFFPARKIEEIYRKRSFFIEQF